MSTIAFVITLHICLEQIMQGTLQNHTSTILVGDREISNFRYDDVIDHVAGSNAELQ